MSIVLCAIPLLLQFAAPVDSQLIFIHSDGLGRIGAQYPQSGSELSYFESTISVVDVPSRRSSAEWGLKGDQFLQKGLQNSHQEISGSGAISQILPVGYNSKGAIYLEPESSGADATHLVTGYDSGAVSIFNTESQNEQLQIGEVINPIIHDFAHQMSHFSSRNPQTNFLFQIANIPGLDLGGLFKKHIFNKLVPRNATMAKVIANDVAPVIAWCLDQFNPSQYKLMYARALGNVLHKRDLLSLNNVDLYAHFLAGDILKAIKMRKSLTTDDYIKAILDADELFFNRFGFKYVDVVEDLSKAFQRELSKGPY